MTKTLTVGVFMTSRNTSTMACTTLIGYRDVQLAVDQFLLVSSIDTIFSVMII